MKRAVLFAAIGLAFIGAAGTGQAQADTYCVELPTDASCDQNFMGPTTAIQAAVSAADDHAGPDNVKIGPGTFVMPSPAYLSNFGEDNRLTITGTGPGTVLSGSDPADPEIHFSAPQGSSINSLTISIPDEASTAAKRGLVLSGDAPVANDLDVNFVSGTTGNRTTGVVLLDGATLSDSTVTLYNTNVNTAVASFGSRTQTVQGSTLTAFTDVDHRNTNGTLEVSKSALIAIGAGGVNLGGTLNIRDSVILNPFGNGDGIYLRSQGAFADTLIDGTTMLGTPGSVGAVVISDWGDPAPANTRFRLTNSVIYGHDYAIVHNTAFAEDTLSISVDSSAYDSTKVAGQPGLGTPQLNIKGLVDLNGVDPMFEDPSNGVYSLVTGSPLIDTGQKANPPVGSKDLVGNPRACHGTATGVVRRDIGAYEFCPPQDQTPPTVKIISAPKKVKSTKAKIKFSSSEAGSKFTCKVNKAKAKPCKSPYKAKLKKGRNTITIIATDRAGNPSKARKVVIKRKK